MVNAVSVIRLRITSSQNVDLSFFTKENFISVTSEYLLNIIFIFHYATLIPLSIRTALISSNISLLTLTCHSLSLHRIISVAKSPYLLASTSKYSLKSSSPFLMLCGSSRLFSSWNNLRYKFFTLPKVHCGLSSYC